MAFASESFSSSRLQRRLQRLHLRLLIGDLLIEAVGQLLEAHRTLQRGARQLVVLLVDGQLRLAHPVGVLLGVVFLLLLQQMQIGERDRHLRLHLDELVLHVENHLLQHLLGILRAIDQIVQIGPYQRCYTIE